MSVIPKHLDLLALVAAAALSVALYAPASTTPVSAQSLLSDDDDDDDDNPCMTSHRMRQFLAGKGYTNIRLNSPIGSRWQAKVESGNQTLLVVVDTCSGTIIGRRALGTT